MEFYAIAHRLEKNMYYDFKEETYEFSIEGTCLLPTKDMAEKFMEENLNENGVLVEIKILSISEDGVIAFSRDVLEYWDTDVREG